MNKRILYLTLKLFNFKISRITHLFIALILGLMINVNANEIKVKQLDFKKTQNDLDKVKEIISTGIYDKTFPNSNLNEV